MLKISNCVLVGCFLLVLISCKKDDGRSCVSCSSSQTSAFEVCEESDGTASVNGENTGTSFEVYIAGLEDAGATCGG
jgi:hypothetical protein